MTHLEREYLVERYMAGEMSAAEEGDFFIHVAVDDELRQTLKAHQLMYGAIRSDSQTAVPETASYRSHILGMLATSHTAVGDGAAEVGGGSIPAGSTVATESVGGGFLAGISLTKVIATVLVGVAIVSGTLAIVLPDSSNDAAGQAAPTRTIAPSVEKVSPTQAPTSLPVPEVRVEAAPSKEVRSTVQQGSVESASSARSTRTSVTRRSQAEQGADAAVDNYKVPVVTLPTKDSVGPIRVETAPNATTPVKR